MYEEKLYVVDGSTAVVRIKDGFQRSVEPAFDRLFSQPGDTDISSSFMAYLCSQDEWNADVSKYGSLFRSNPDLIGMLPRCRLVYEVIELEDGFFIMFPDEAAIPKEMKESLWDDQRGKHRLYARIRRKADNSHLRMIDYILTQTYSDIDLVTRAHAPKVSFTLRAFCAHGFKTPPDWDELVSDDPRPPYTLEWLLSTPPEAWFKAIGKYALEPGIKNLTMPAREWNPTLDPWDGRKGPEPKVTHQVNTMHWGWDRFVECMEMLRQLLFRPTSDRQLWPWFWGPSTTGKTCMADIWIKEYYPESAQCVCKGNFATGNMSAGKRIVLFEEFRGKVTITHVDQMLRLSDVGRMEAEAKRKQGAIVTNFAVKTGDSNPPPGSWYKAEDVDALTNRWIFFFCGIRHEKMDPNIARDIRKNWILVVAYLAGERWLDGHFPRPTDSQFGNHYREGLFPSREHANMFIVGAKSKSQIPPVPKSKIN